MRIYRVVLYLWLAFPLGALTNINKINSLQFYSNIAYYKLIFKTTSPSRYHFFTLTNPNRLVFDIQNAHLTCFFPPKLFKQTPIKDIRTAIHKDNILRMVFDLKYPIKINAFVLKGNHKNSPQLVIYLLAKKPSDTYDCLSRSNLKSKNKTPFHKILPYRSQDVIVVIDPGHGGCDPGHGGCDPGAIGPGGVHEKDIVLKISHDLKKDINRQPGFKAYLTRNGDYYLTLRQRLAIARCYKADMFIAIHADAYKDHKAQGASVFALSLRGATSEAARWLAKKENESELIGGVNLTDKNNLLKSVLINLSQTATIHASLLIGKQIIHALNSTLTLHHHCVEQAAFVVLKSPDITSLLVETGFISNTYEEHRLLKRIYQRRIASALMQGIRDYFVHSPPPGTWLAEQKFAIKRRGGR